MTENEKPKRLQNAVLEKLIALFPAFRDTQPLAIGIHKAILERLPDLPKEQVSKALRIHTGSTRYLRALSNAQQRFDLDGNEAGEVTTEQRDAAAKLVTERRQRAAEKRKAELTQQREQERTRRQQEKLQQLAAKFNKR